MVNKLENCPQLYLSEVNSNFKPERDYVLGPWCFVGREKEFPNWHELPYTDAFEQPSNKALAVKKTAELVSFFVSDLSEILNQRHSRNYPVEYWWILLVRWLLVLIPGLWRRWVNIELTANQLKNKIITVKIDNQGLSPILKFKNTQDFIYYGSSNRKFDFWINSLFLSDLAPSSWNLQKIAAPDVTTPAPTNTIHLGKTNFFKQKIKSALGHMPFSDVPGAGGFSSLVMSTYINTLKLKKDFKRFHGQPIFLPPKYFPEKFVILAQEIVQLVMPASFTDDFSKLETLTKRRGFKKGRICVTGAATVSDKNNFELAHAHLTGERIVRCQHGSDYGTMKNTIQEGLPEYPYSAFLTWGWKVENSFEGNFIPAPAPLLSKYKNSYKKKSEKIILVGSKMWVFPTRIDQTPEPSYAIEYRKNKIDLVNNLAPLPKNNLVYRPYLRGLSDLEDEEYFRLTFPKIPILRGDLHGCMRKCKLVVLDHPGTTMHFALSMGVPTLMFWPKNIWPVSKHAKPYFDSLVDAEIIHHSPMGVAQKINEIFHDTEQWWHQPDIQLARLKWTKEFASTSKNWWLEWFKILHKL